MQTSMRTLVFSLLSWYRGGRGDPNKTGRTNGTVKTAFGMIFLSFGIYPMASDTVTGRTC